MSFSSSTSDQIVDHILERFALGRKFGKKLSGSDQPGFEALIRLSTQNYVSLHNTTFDKSVNVLKTKYKAIPEVCGLSEEGLSLATCLALIDEHNVLAVFGTKPYHCRAGLSLNLSGELLNPIPLNTELVVVSTITKMGRKIAFCTGEIVDDKTGMVSCRVLHVKYLPQASAFLDFMTATDWIWPISKAYFDWVDEPPPIREDLESLQDGVVLQNIEHSTTSKDCATGQFAVSRRHTNPFNFLHGGCQAILMEMLSRQLAQRLFPNASNLWLRSIEIQYLSAIPISSQLIDLEAKVVSRKGESELLVQVGIVRKGKVCSSGFLRWESTKA